ncbi:DUF7341 domain-containing protein [Micromonospora zamorensis]|uniref:DUF7341 domain-containing protein n=1 Tax=Micromonospora zamorensis TaxID=709883 RepID=UPI003795873C
MTTTRQAAEIAELAEELADARQHIEPITGRDRWRNKTMRAVWVTSHAGLLDQLAEVGNDTGGTSDSAGTSRPHPGSRPPGRWEALALSATIAAEVFLWITDLGLDGADTTTANVRALAGHAQRLDDADAAELVTAMRRWRHQAAVLTGWATRMWAPNIACPVADCGKTTSLRIHVDRRLGYCTACRAQWDDTEGSYGVLVNYIAATGDPAQRRTNRIRSGRAGHGAWVTDQPIGQ